MSSPAAHQEDKEGESANDDMITEANNLPADGIEATMQDQGALEQEDTTVQGFNLEEEQENVDQDGQEEQDIMDHVDEHRVDQKRIDWRQRLISLQNSWQWLRERSRRLRKKMRYHAFFLLVSIASSISLLLRLTITASSIYWLNPFFLSDVVSAVLFTLDVLIGVIAYGFCSHPESYFRMNLYNKV